jgi:hypothetical protein
VLLVQVVETTGLQVVVEVVVHIMVQLLAELGEDLVDLLPVLVMEHKEELHQELGQVKILVLVEVVERGQQVHQLPVMELLVVPVSSSSHILDKFQNHFKNCPLFSKNTPLHPTIAA